MKLFIWSLLAASLAVPLGQEPTAVDPAPRINAANRFLARNEPPLTQAIALRHLVATTRGGSMTGWIDACTALDAGELRYWIIDEGGSGAVRKPRTHRRARWRGQSAQREQHAGGARPIEL